MVLTYHRITDEPDFQEPLKVSLSNFEKQIVYLKKNYRIVSGDELAEIIRRKDPFPKNACLITFDDGWKDNFTNALPVLIKYGVPAIVFVSTDYVGTDKVFWHEQLALALMSLSGSIDISRYGDCLSSWPQSVLKKVEVIATRPKHLRRRIINEMIEYLKGFDEEINRNMAQELDALLGAGQTNSTSLMLSWEEISEMSKADIDIGSHGKSHSLLTHIGEGRVMSELIESKSIIEERVNRPVNFLAYPNGNYNQEIKKAAQKAGYLASFTCLPGINRFLDDVFVLKRKHIHEELSLGLNGRFSDLFFKIELANVRSSLKRRRTVEEY